MRRFKRAASVLGSGDFSRLRAPRLAEPPPRRALLIVASAARRSIGLSCFACAALTVIAGPANASASGELPGTVGELSRLVSASRARYVSLEVTARVTSFRGADDRLPGSASVTSDTKIIYRRTPTRKCVSEDREEFDGPLYSQVLHPRETRTYSAAPRWAKRLIEFHGDKPRAPSAVIQRPGSGLEDAPMDFTAIVWGNCNIADWGEFFDDATPLEQMPADGLCRMSQHVENPDVVLSVTVDPARAWLPVSCRVDLPTGEWFFKEQCEDIRPVGDGLYFPYKFEYWASGMHTRTPYVALSVVEVEDVRVNAIPADEPLDIVFPNGTDVHDLIANLHYVVDSREPDGRGRTNRIMRVDDLTGGGPADEEDLRRAAKGGGRAPDGIATHDVDRRWALAPSTWLTIVLLAAAVAVASAVMRIVNARRSRP